MFLHLRQIIKRNLLFFLLWKIELIKELVCYLYLINCPIVDEYLIGRESLWAVSLSPIVIVG